MTVFAIKCGMSSEADLARKAFPGVPVLSGALKAADFERLVPVNCEGMISLGLCGGLSVNALLGQVFLATELIDDAGNVYVTDQAWRKRIFARTHLYARRWFSPAAGPDNQHQADTPEQRKAIFDKTGCWVIDDESTEMAKFCQKRDIPFECMRSVSDTAYQTVPRSAFGALNPDGTANVGSIIWWLIKHPLEAPKEVVALREIASDYFISMATLERATALVKPDFCWA